MAFFRGRRINRQIAHRESVMRLVGLDDMIHLGACQSLLQPLLLFIREACILDGAGDINPRRDGLRELMRAIRTLGGEVPAMEGSDGREARQAICLLRCARLIVALCLVFGLCINAGSNGLGAILQRLSWTNGVVCASKMIALSIPPLIGLGVLMRRGAPTDTRGTALLVGWQLRPGAHLSLPVPLMTRFTSPSGTASAAES